MAVEGGGRREEEEGLVDLGARAGLVVSCAVEVGEGVGVEEERRRE